MNLQEKAAQARAAADEIKIKLSADNNKMSAKKAKQLTETAQDIDTKASILDQQSMYYD